MKTARKMDLLKPSETLAMMEKAEKMAEQGKRILHMEIGEPDFNTPYHIKEALFAALKGEFTHYTSSRGIIELRNAISEGLKKKKIEADPKNEIIVTPGAKHAIYCATLATVDPGSEVLVLSPSWPTYETCIQAAEARFIEVPTSMEYRLDEEVLKEKITDKTAMIIVNSPNNPTGGVLSEKEMRSIAELSEDHDLLVLSDEIYDKIAYDGNKPMSMAAIEGMKERTIIVNGFSKAYAMTGWRLGYVVADKEVTNAINTMQQATTTCAASFVQKAGVAALTGPQECLEEMLHEYNRRRETLVSKLSNVPGISCPKPKGAFYAFPDFSALKLPSNEIVAQLLEKEGVCSTAGDVFGKPGEGCIRLSYATSLETILEATERIKEFAERNSQQK